MKKKIIASVLVLVVAVSFVLCLRDKVASVRIDSYTSYQTVYLYYFEDANVSNYSIGSSDKPKPTSNGYIYSTTEYSKGDKITVWGDYNFSGNDYFGYGTKGTTAYVKKVVKTYRVRTMAFFDRYRITYYTIPETSCASERRDLDDIEKNKINVPEDFVYITYDTK